jgi:protoporphyrinogen oxidase
LPVQRLAGTLPRLVAQRTALTILGGGPAGLAVAYYAHRTGVPFALFERAEEPGGLCRTFRWDAHGYDAGAHRFHDRDPEVTRDVRALLADRLAAVHAPSQIWHRGRFVAFPPRPIGWLLAQGAGEAVRIGADLLRARWRPRPERTFEALALNRYGARLGKPLLIDYSEKLWGLPASELAPDVATRRLSGLDLRGMLAGVAFPRRRATHLDGSFLYPHDGYGAISAALVASLPPGCVHTGCEVTGFDCGGGRIRAIRIADRPPVPVEGRVVGTLPLSLLARLLGDAVPAGARQAAARLRFRHVRIVFLRLAAARVSANATIYLPDPALCVSRVSEPKNRSPALAPADETGLLAEVPCSTGDAIATLADDALATRVTAELARVGLVEPRAVLGWRHHFLPNAYPVYSLDWAAAAEAVRAGLGTIGNLDLLGRAGLFWYSHLHDQLRAAKDLVRSAAAHAPQDTQQLATHAGAHP